MIIISVPSDFVNRDCYSGEESGDKCENQITEGRKVRVCTMFCDKDGCNNAPAQMADWILITSCTFVYILAILR